MTCIFQHNTRRFFQSFHITFTGRTVDHTCLTETTASNAASLDLKSYTVLCCLNVRNNRCLHSTIFFLHINDQLFLNLLRNIIHRRCKGCDRTIFFIGNFIERRNINSRNLSCCQKKILPAASSLFIGLVSIKKCIINSFSLSNIEQVKKRCQWLRIIRTGTATDHNREILTTVCALQRDTTEIQYLEDIGVAHFVPNRNSKKIKIPDRFLGLQCKQRDLLLPHHLIQIRPWRKETFTPYVLSLVEHVIEDHHAQV